MKNKTTISSSRLTELNAGTAETANLMEALAIDIPMLVATVFSELKLDVDLLKCGITKRMSYIAEQIYVKYGFAAFEQLHTHHSDTLRSIACIIISINTLPLSEQLSCIKSLADDHHFSVREWAWMALRPKIIMELDEALTLLEPWVHHPSERIRRYATEITRPRGVWCSHIRALRTEPWKALHLLDTLHADPARYVQLSVGNWLNDASKDHPEWVRELCARWQKNSTAAEATKKIYVRALRTVSKSEKRP